MSLARASNPPTDSQETTPDFAFTGAQCPECLGADLELTADDETAIASRGATLVYTLLYTHSGADVANGVAITVTVPEHTTFDPGDSTDGWQPVPAGTGDYVFQLFDLDPGDTGSVLFAVKVSTTAPVGELTTFTATIADDGLHGPDKTPDNNVAEDSNLITRGPTFVCGTIEADTLWERLDGPFIVTCDIVIPAGVTLTLEPGTVVRFNSDTGIRVSGTLLAEGTEVQPLVLTTNNSLPRRGDWDGVDVFAGGRADFAHATVEYGGSTTDNFDALLYVAVGATATVRDSTFALSDVYGAWSAGGDLIVEDSLLRDNDGFAVRLETSSPEGASRVVGNTFLRSGSYPISVEYAGGTTGEIRGNVGSDNTTNAVVVSGTTGGAVTWEVNEGLPYVIGGGDLLVAAGSTLLARPGVVVKLETASSDLNVDGTLISEGTTEEPVAFTSIRDDAFGGDTNGDGSGSTPDPGDWGRIYLRPGSTGNSLRHFVVAYGASSSYGNFGQMRSDVPELAVSECVFRGSRGVGLYLPGGAEEVSHCRFESNGAAGLHAELTGTRNLRLESNIFLDNSGYAVFLRWVGVAGSLTFAGNAASGNLTNAAAVEGSVSGEFTVDASGQVGFPLRLSGDLTVSSGATLTLSPGTVVKGASGSHDVLVDGTLVAEGTAAQPVVFTSVRDDAFGGDTNGDGDSSSPAPGDWGQVNLRSGSGGHRLTHCVFAYGASTPHGNYGILRSATSQLTVSDCRVEGSARHGIYASGASFPISGSVVRNNVGMGVYFDDLGAGTDVSLLGNTFEGNSDHAAFVDLIDADGRIVLGGNSAAGNGTNGLGLQGTLNGDFTLDASAQDDLAVRLNNSLTVKAASTLTLSPGTVLKFPGGSYDLVVDGTLSAVGTAARPVVFTSVRDDSRGGDTNGDGSSVAAPGDWGRIELTGNSSGHVLSHCEIAYGGSTPNGNAANLETATGDLTFSSCTVRSSQASGLFASAGAPDILQSTFRDNAGAGAVVTHSGTALRTVQGNTFADNGGAGFRANLGAVAHLAVLDNTFQGNGQAAFFDLGGVSGDVTLSGNAVSGNGSNSAGVRGTVAGDLSLDWSGQPDFALRLADDVTVAAGATLSLSPGVVFKGSDGSHDVLVDGTLVAEGTAAQPIVFTSDKDDTFGGDTNGDGDGSSPSPGDWGQLYLRSGSGAHRLSHCVVAYGGNTPHGNLGALRSATSQLTMSDCRVEGSERHGVYALGVSFPISGSVFRDNVGMGVYLDDLRTGVDVSLAGNTFEGNSDHAVFVDLIGADGQVVLDGNSAAGNGTNGLGLQGTLNGDFSLDASAQNDFAVRLNNSLTVHSAATLTLSPGTIVKFPGGAYDLVVEGTLSAAGTVAQPVVFTSVRDDAHGGDTNGDGPSTAAPGDWGQIHLTGGSSGHVLSHCEVAYGGNSANGNAASLYTETPEATFASCTVRSSQTSGFLASAGAPDVLQSTFRDNAGAGAVVTHSGAALRTVQGNTFADNGGVGFRANLGAVAHLAVLDNTFQGNSQAAFFDFSGVSGDVTLSGNAVSGNGSNSAGVQGTVAGDLSLDWSAQPDFALRLAGDVTVAAGATLELSPGVVFKAASGGYDVLVDGILLAEGTAAQPIVFTSDKDDAFGGDTNGDGAGSSPSPGDWGQLYLRSGSGAHRLSHCVVAYGGNAANGNFGVLRSATSQLTMSDCRVEGSQRHGVYAVGVSFPITGSVFRGNTGKGVYFEDMRAGVDVSLLGNTFQDSSDHAVFVNLINADGRIVLGGNSAAGNGINGLGLQGTLNGDFTLDASAQDDFAVRLNNSLTVKPAATLTLSPGTVLKFPGGSYNLVVDGTLSAAGTAARPVVFTSARDDTHGGDTNGDGSSVAAPGDWGRIELTGDSSGHVLTHCEIAYGGSTPNGNAANLEAATGDLTFSFCTIRSSGASGLLASAGAPDILESTFRDNAAAGVVVTHSGAALRTVQGNTFADNGGAGFRANLGAVVHLAVLDNTFQGNGQAAFFDLGGVSGDVTLSGNAVSGNGSNSAGVQGTVAGDLSLDWSGQPDFALRLAGDVTVAAGATLELSPGVVFKAANGAYDVLVDGTLVAEGTAAQPIVFTSDKDDDFGGDTNGDGAGSSPSPGEWGQLYLRSGSGAHRLSHCVVAYGGNTAHGNLGALRSATSQLTMSDCRVEGSQRHGVYALGVSFPITGSVFRGNVGQGVYFDDLRSGVDVSLVSNLFEGNSDHAVFVDLIDADGRIVLDGNGATGNGTNGLGLQGTLNGPFTLDGSAQSDFAVRLNSDFTVKPAATLTIAPGTVLKPGGPSFDVFVDGTLVAAGTAAQPVVITSIHDDAHGGDTNGNGSATSPAPGDWGSLRLRSGSSGHVLDHGVLAFGGSTPYGNQANLQIEVDGVTVSNYEIRSSQRHGVYALHSSFDVTSSTLEANAELGLFLDDFTTDTFVTVSDSAFLGNGTSAALLDLVNADGQLTLSGNSVSGNQIDAVTVRGNVSGALTLDWSQQTGFPLRYTSDLTVAAGATLTLSPGVVLKATGGGVDLQVNGTLLAEGLAERPVVFTSIADDRFGGDTNGDGAATSPAAGNWGQVRLRPGSVGHRLSQCVVAYGAAAAYGNLGNLRADVSDFSLSSCTIEHSQRHGLYVNSLTAAPPPISGNNFTGNAQFGLLNDSSVVIDARGNWWGDASGPFHATQNPAGLGDAVSDNVLFDPWATAPLPVATSSPLTPVAPVPAAAPPAEAVTAPLAKGVLPGASAPVRSSLASDVPGGTEPHDTDKQGSPPLPSGFYGTVSTDGVPVPEGTLISAWVNGVLCAEVPARLVDGEAVYVLNVPGDAMNTPEVEGGVPGDVVVLKIAGADADQTGVWKDAGLVEIHLTSTSKVDLAVTVDDGTDTLSAAETVSWVLQVTNQGVETATGIIVTDLLPEDVLFVSASDGGSFDAATRTVTWPPFELAPEASANRIVTAQVAPALPAGLEELTQTARVADDGTHGVDPQANNTAQDTDTVDAAPDLALSAGDGLDEVSPGTLIDFTVTLANQGTQGATGVALTAMLPAPITYFAASDDGIFADGAVTWPEVELGAGVVVERSVSLRLDDPLSPSVLALSYSASVHDDTANGADLDPSDNDATDTTAVIRRPDLRVPSVDISATSVDLDTLALSGDVLLELENRGNLDAGPFEVTVFEDSSGDGAFTPAIDVLLGQAAYGIPLTAGERVPFVVPVSGTVAFRDVPIHAFIDSAEVIVEHDESNNVSNSGTACQAQPAPEDFNPVVKASWPEDDANLSEPLSRETVSTPITAQLTDDDGNGKIDENDVPDIVFVTANLVNPLDPKLKLRAIRGDTLDSIFLVDPPVSVYYVFFGLTGLATGDIDGDGIAEIIVHGISPPLPPFSGFSNHMVAYEHTGARKWVSQAYVTHPTGGLTNRDHPTLADLEGDGTVEIVVGGNVLNPNGTLRWAGTGGQAYQSARNDDGVDSGAISVVANLDLVGDQEIVAGNTAYRSDGSIYWQVEMDDGYPAVGNFDEDPYPEIVVVARGFVRLHEHDGTLIWGPVELPGAGDEAGGAPTVADFDGDGEPEIGVAGSTLYTVFETDGSVKWQRNVQDGSSNMTGSTVFDFDGDGRFEVVYRDETRLRIYRGEDGVVLFEDPFSSFTANESPVVADVDRDGQAEILVTSDLATQPPTNVPERTFGIRIYGDANGNWVGTRGIWNQHAYHVDNVNDDGTIPRRPEFSWLTHNTFRAQVAPPGVAFASPDLTASRGRLDVSGFPQTLIFAARVGNAGGTFVGAGLPVAFYDGDPADGGELIDVALLGSLPPGGFQDVSVVWTSPRRVPGTVYVVADDDGTGQGRRNECDEANNVYAFDYDLSDLGLFLEKDDSEETVRRGEQTTYTLEITNYFNGTAGGVLLRDVLPEHTSFVAASDGGVLSAPGEVSWPSVDLESLETVTRTLTVEVDTSVAPEVTDLTNTATVTYDGGLGTDPTPGNNTDTDVDALVLFVADANGPYSGGEGEVIQLDASATDDPEAQVTAYDWDTDGDGVFDASGVTPTVSYVDEGSFTALLRVTALNGLTDTASSAVVISNLPPVVDAGAAQTVGEGDGVVLGATFADAGLEDVHTATVDWDDGTAEDATVGGSAAAGTVAGNHVYPDDGAFAVRVCVLDNDGGEGCDTLDVTVENRAPVVEGVGPFDLTAWHAEDHLSCYDGGSEWIVAEGGESVTQTKNSVPTLFYSNFPAVGARVEGRIRVVSDPSLPNGDFVGFLLGFQPEETTNPDAEYLLIDWRREDQSFHFGCGGFAQGRTGLAVSRVFGVPADAELWAHDDRTCNGSAESPPLDPPEGTNGVEELVRATNLGATGWEYDREYTFALLSSPGRLQVYVDGVLEADLTGDFPDGRVAFYGYSQAQVVYSGFNLVSLVGDEGRPVDIRLVFTDAGVLDTHTATIDWGDGSPVGPGALGQIDDFDVVTGTHVYADNGTFTLQVCVTDDDGGTGCGDVPVEIRNLPPVVEAGEKVLAGAGEPVVLEPSTFTDAGVPDTHTATIDWGDGTVEAGALTQGAGSGTVAGSHSYAVEDNYVVEVCVTDDDGDTGCDSFQVNAVLDLALEKTSDASGSPGGGQMGRVIEPGQVITYTLTAENHGTLETTGVELVDTLSEFTNFITASDGGVYDPVAHTTTWDLAILEPGESVTVTITVQVDFVLPVGAMIRNSAHVTDDGSQGPNVDPGNPDDDDDGTDNATLTDLTIPSLDEAAVTIDAETLSLSGTLGVEVLNQGGLDVTDPFRVTVFLDADGDRLLTAGTEPDPVFGEADVTDPLAAGSSVSVPVPLAGPVRFGEDLIWAFADSADAVAEVDETNNLRSTGESCRRAAPVPERTYTLDAEFDEGALFNVTHQPPYRDELRLGRITEPLPFLWVAASGRGTVLKIDTVTGEILGEYLSAPDGRGRNPSRTTVELTGGVWVGNRAEASGGKGSAVHIGITDSFQCVDRNGNGEIDTSTGLGDVRPWPNTGGADNAGGVSTAQDECIIHYVRTNATAVRTVAVNADNNVWIGGTGNRVHDLVDGETGEILQSVPMPCGGYGGFVHPDGTLWSARSLLRYDPATGEARCIAVGNSYGLNVDGQGNVWNSQWTSARITKLAADGTILDTFPSGGGGSRGVAVTADDDIWIANSGSNTVTRLSNEGELLATIQVGSSPTGVAVDAAGKVWVTNLGSNSAMRIDPADNSVDLEVDLGARAAPYNYSDMTGAVALRLPSLGRWTVIHDGGQPAIPWGRVSWSRYLPEGSAITARARSAESTDDLEGAAWTEVENGIDAGLGNGRFLEVEVTLRATSAGDTPILYDVTVEPRTGLPDLSADFRRKRHLPDAVELTVRIGNSGAFASPAGTPVAFYDGDPAAGGSGIGLLTDLPELAPGASHDLVFVWQSPPAGASDVFVVANDDGTGNDQGPVVECDRSNNTDVETVEPVPDLAIPSLDRSSVVTDLQALTISGNLVVGLANQGNLSVVDPFTVTLWEDSDGDGRLTAGRDNVLGSAEHVGTIEPGGSATLSVPVTGSVAFRDNVVYAFADSADVIVEGDEDNNINSTGALCGTADLTASRILVDLSNPGLEIPVTVRVGNGGAVAAPAGVSVAFYDGDPAAGGTLLGTAATSGLVPEEFEDLTFVWTPPPAPGNYTVFVVVDDGGTVAECDEANNACSLTFTVPTVPDLTLTKDDGRNGVVPGLTYTYTLTVTNAGTREATGIALEDVLPQHVTLVAVSDGGSESAGKVTWPLFSLAAGASVERTVTVRVDPAIPADVTEITNTATVADDGTGGPDPTPENNTATDTNGRQNNPNAADDTAETPEDVPVVVDVLANDSDDDGDPLAVESVSDPSNGTVELHEDGTVTYTPAPDFHGTDSFTYTVVDGTGGSDTATVTVEVLSVNDPPVAENDFAETDQDVAIVLDLLANDSDVDGDPLSFLMPPAPFGGTAEVQTDNTVLYTPAPGFSGFDVFFYTITDGQGGSDTASVSVSVLLVDDEPPVIDISGVIDGGCGNVDVTPVISASDPNLEEVSATLNGDPFESGTTITAEGDYTLIATASDTAGNVTTETVTFTIDMTEPAVTITGVPDGACVNLAVTPEVTVSDLHLDVVTVTLNGEPFTSGTEVSAEGDYVLEVTASDACGNSRDETRSWTIDTTPPEITITGVADGSTVDTDVTPVIEVFDVHLGTVTTTLNGEPFESGTTITAEGDYMLVVTADDDCGNNSSETVTFTIDKTPPSITVTGVTDGECVRADVTPVIEVTDTHLASQAATLNGQPYTSGTPVTAEGDYTLVVDASDTAGNTSSETLTFTIDKTPPAITITGIADGSIVNVDVTPVIEVTDVHLGPVTTTLNGEPFESGTTITAEGDYTLVVTASDDCGNSSSETVTFTIDKTPPVITITGIADGDCVNVDVTPVIEVTDTHLDTVTTTLNGAPYTSGTPVTSEGDHTLVVNASDTAGNTSSQTVTFTIDKTPPAITITGVSDGTVFHTEVTAVIEVTDTHLATVTTTLNGAPYTSGTPITADGDYTLVVTANDDCGNTSTETVTFTIRRAEDCELYPIALYEGSLNGVNVGDEIPDIFNGAQPGNFGWLTWTGAVDVPTTVESLTPPGDSDTYVNVYDPDDHVVSIGDWIQGSTGVANAGPIRNALDVLKTMDIVIPVWDQVEGQGSNVRYHTVDFTRVRITDYHLSTPNTISAVYLGPVVCIDSP